MKKTKRILSLVLTLMMVLSTMAFTPVFAEEPDWNFPEATLTAEEEVAGYRWLLSETITLSETVAFRARIKGIFNANGIASDTVVAFDYATKGVDPMSADVNASFGSGDVENIVFYTSGTGTGQVGKRAYTGTPTSEKYSNDENSPVQTLMFPLTRTYSDNKDAFFLEINNRYDQNKETTYGIRAGGFGFDVDGKKYFINFLVYADWQEGTDYDSKSFVFELCDASRLTDNDFCAPTWYKNNWVNKGYLTFALPDHDFNWPEAEGWEVSQVLPISDHVAFRARAKYTVTNDVVSVTNIAYDFATKLSSDPGTLNVPFSFGTTLSDAEKITYCVYHPISGNMIGTHFSGSAEGDNDYFHTLGGALKIGEYVGSDYIQTVEFNVTDDMNLVLSSGETHTDGIARVFNSVQFTSSDVLYQIPIVLEAHYGETTPGGVKPLKDVKLWISTRDSMNTVVCVTSTKVRSGQTDFTPPDQSIGFNSFLGHSFVIGTIKSGYGVTAYPWRNDGDAKEVAWYEAEFNGTQYHTVAAALAAAGSSGTVQLISDAREVGVVVPADVTLDLNGYTLTADSLAVFGELDADNGSVNAGDVTLPNDSTLLPIYDAKSGSYQLFEHELADYDLVKDGNNTAQKITNIVLNDAAYDLIASGESKLALKFKLAVGGEEVATFVCDDDTLAEWAEMNKTNPGKYGIRITVTGVEELGGQDFTLTPILDNKVPSAE